MKRCNKLRGRKGITLVEVMISAVVLVLFAVGVVSAITYSSKNISDNPAKSGISAKASECTDMLISALNSGTYFTYSETPPAGYVLNDAGIENITGVLYASELPTAGTDGTAQYTITYHYEYTSPTGNKTETTASLSDINDKITATDIPTVLGFYITLRYYHEGSYYDMNAYAGNTGGALYGE